MGNNPGLLINLINPGWEFMIIPQHTITPVWRESGVRERQKIFLIKNWLIYSVCLFYCLVIMDHGFIHLQDTHTQLV